MENECEELAELGFRRRECNGSTFAHCNLYLLPGANNSPVSASQDNIEGFTVSQAGLEPLTSSDSPVSASRKHIEGSPTPSSQAVDRNQFLEC
ncbi:hypothetical protein AAY473_036487 [Plecturocebus cupreus]